MGKIVIITDSIACLPPDKIQHYGIRIVPINISYDNRKYHDGVDLSVAEAYRMLRERPDQFYSSPASIGEYSAVFQEAARDAEGILCITLSSRLSAMHNVAVLAMRQAKAQMASLPLEVLDSRTAAVGEGLIVLAAAAAVNAGKSLKEVIQLAEKTRAGISVIGIMETMRYVYRTGRIPKLAARFGSILNIRPIFVISGGVVRIVGVTQDQEKGIARALQMMREKIQDRPVRVAIAHADAREVGEKLKARIEADFACQDIWLTDFSPVMAYATGTGVLAIGYHADEP